MEITVNSFNPYLEQIQNEIEDNKIPIALRVLEYVSSVQDRAVMENVVEDKPGDITQNEIVNIKNLSREEQIAFLRRMADD